MPVGARCASKAAIGGALHGYDHMKRIFISHAGQDTAVAVRLCGDLRNVGHEVQIDTEELELGDDIIDFINSAINDSDTVIIIYSNNTPCALWQRQEINAALSTAISQEGAEVIVLKRGVVNLPPLLRPRLYGHLDDDTYQKTLQKLCSKITDQHGANISTTNASEKISPNPFRRVRAEYFDDQDPRLLAESFSPPEAAKIRVFEDTKPCFLEGSRGTGKTMLLLSLRARVLSARVNSKKLGDLFGCYVRLDRGAFCNVGPHLMTPDSSAPIEDQRELSQLTNVFEQEFYLGVIESLVSEIEHCSTSRKLAVNTIVETALVRSVASTLSQPDAASIARFGDLLSSFSALRRQLSDFVKRKFIYRETRDVPFTFFNLDMFKEIVKSIKSHIPSLTLSIITILLDEYENLLPYQKTVVNTLVKFGPPHISVKVAQKVGTEVVSSTTVQQELQETHDYNRVNLIYSVEPGEGFSRYIRLLENIVTNLFVGQQLTPVSLARLLPKDCADEITPKECEEEVTALVTRGRFESWDKAKQAKKLSYYREAAIYRRLYGRPGRRTKKRFSGHEELAFVSSGVIRYFQEILATAYDLQQVDPDTDAPAIAPHHQTAAVYRVSNDNLATLSRNIETHGEKLKYFLLDLGDCLRQKLLHHSSEPEAARLALKDPGSLLDERYDLLRQIISIGVKEGVFQTVDGRPGLRPRHTEDPQPEEINIARIYAPTLGISPRLRWRTEVGCFELAGLLNDDLRRRVKRDLISRLVPKRAAHATHATQLPFKMTEEER